MGGNLSTGLHLHIGPGRLGVGLVVVTGLGAKLDVHLLTHKRSSLSQPARFRLLTRGVGGDTNNDLPELRLCKADTLNDVPEDIHALLCDSPELLITIAATTKGLELREQFLLDLAESRKQSPDALSTIFIPCENDPGPQYPRLKTALERLAVDCRDTMVNRLCSEYNPLHDGSVEVVVDEFAEWVIEGECNGQAMLAALDGAPYVNFVPDVAPYELRKRWLVNGGHLALAIVAHAGDIPTIDTAAAEPGRSQWLEQVHAGLIQALDQRYPGLDGNTTYASNHVAAWMRHEDDVSRILRRLLRADPLPFFDDLERKLIEPIGLLGDLTPFPELKYILDRLHRTLQKASSYVDYQSFKKFLPTLPTAVDVNACQRYLNLLQPILGGAEARDRAEGLASAFEFQREELKRYPSS